MIKTCEIILICRSREFANKFTTILEKEEDFKDKYMNLTYFNSIDDFFSVKNMDLYEKIYYIFIDFRCGMLEIGNLNILFEKLKQTKVIFLMENYYRVIVAEAEQRDGLDYKENQSITKILKDTIFDEKVKESKNMMFKTDRGYVWFPTCEIVYFENINKKVYLHTSTSEVLKIKNEFITKLKEKYNLEGFIYSHRDFLVNSEFIFKVVNKDSFLKGKRYSSSSVILKTDQVVPISKYRKKEMMSYLKETL